MIETNADRQKCAWFALVGLDSCRLLCFILTRRGKYHVDEYDTFANTLPDRENLQPMTKTGTTHHVEVNERRYESHIVGWLQKRAEQYEIDYMTILAPSGMLEVLQMIPLGSLKGHVEELKGDLMLLVAAQLAEHPMVRELIRPHTHEGRATIDAATSIA